MIAERDEECLSELAVLCIEKQALRQAALEVLAVVCCGGEEEQDQVTTIELLSYTLCIIKVCCGDNCTGIVVNRFQKCCWI